MLDMLFWSSEKGDSWTFTAPIGAHGGWQQEGPLPPITLPPHIKKMVKALWTHKSMIVLALPRMGSTLRDSVNIISEPIGSWCRCLCYFLACCQKWGLFFSWYLKIVEQSVGCNYWAPSTSPLCGHHILSSISKEQARIHLGSPKQRSGGAFVSVT